ncbi:hypothetical protein [Streptomyces sp. NPDC056480]|uniref:hypothetical protein n=1 Tax=Streptomyces sp. NPDC056480 TaxID=3345833 RepID=UPI00369DAEC6
MVIPEPSVAYRVRGPKLQNSGLLRMPSSGGLMVDRAAARLSRRHGVERLAPLDVRKTSRVENEHIAPPGHDDGRGRTAGLPFRCRRRAPAAWRTAMPGRRTP